MVTRHPVRSTARIASRPSRCRSPAGDVRPSARACRSAGRTCGCWRRRGSTTASGRHGARVRHRLVEEQLEEVVAEVVMGGDVVAVTSAHVAPPPTPDAIGERTEHALQSIAVGVDRRQVADQHAHHGDRIVTRPPALDEPPTEADRALERRPLRMPAVVHGRSRLRAARSDRRVARRRPSWCAARQGSARGA